MKRGISIVIFLSLVLFKQSLAGELKGNISTYFNSYQTQDLYTEEKTSYFRAYQSFRFDLNQIGTKTLSFHTYFRSTTDFIHKGPDDPTTKIYNVYLDWKNIKKVLNLRLGRQFLYAGVGNGTMDGLRFDFKPKQKLQLTGYVGFQLPRERSTNLDTWEKSHIFGGELATTYLKDTRLAISYVQKEREKTKEEQFLAANLTHLHKKFDFFSQFYYNLVYKKAQNFTLRGTGSELFGELYISLEYQYRQPSIYSNSIFSVFKQESYSLYRFTGTYQPIKNFRFSSEYDLTLYKSDNSSRTRFGVEYSFIALGLNFRRGYGGESNGVYGKIIHTFNKNFVFSVSADYGKYKIDEEQESKDESLAISSRVEWEPLRNFQLALEVQDVRNKIKNYDLRLQGKASYRFGVSF
ncbi:MAG: hypothetical protein V1890_02530 [Candidatus Zixiibacteriota bacterium]